MNTTNNEAVAVHHEKFTNKKDLHVSTVLAVITLDIVSKMIRVQESQSAFDYNISRKQVAFQKIQVMENVTQFSNLTTTTKLTHRRNFTCISFQGHLCYF